MSERSTRFAKAAALALLVLLGTCAVVRSQKGAPLAAPPPIVASAPATTTMAHTTPREGPTPRGGALGPLPPVIDAITIEKDEVCEGEENLVTVQAHTTDGNDPFLHYQIGSGGGASVPLRSYLDDRGRPTAHRISVFGKNNVVTTAPVPSFRVKTCDPGPSVLIEHRLLPNATREFEFRAHIVSRGAKSDAAASPSFRARAYAWTFGDGERREGRDAEARHKFASSQTTLYSHYVVAVEVLGDDGVVLKGRRSLELLNSAFEAFAYKGIVVLATDLDPRFPILSAAGVVDQGIRLSHARPDTVIITKLTVTTRYAETSRRASPAVVPAASVLGRSEVPADRGLAFHVTLDTRTEPDVIARDYALEGRTLDGQPVRGSFSVMKPPALPTKEHHDRITDPVLLAKVKMAREILHREFVTDEDIGALERAGKLRGTDGGAL